MQYTQYNVIKVTTQIINIVPYHNHPVKHSIGSYGDTKNNMIVRMGNSQQKHTGMSVAFARGSDSTTHFIVWMSSFHNRNDLMFHQNMKIIQTNEYKHLKSRSYHLMIMPVMRNCNIGRNPDV